MAWYAYCIAEQRAFQGELRARRPFPVTGVRGVGGAQVFGFPSGEFAVIVSEHVRGEVVEQRAVVEHASVVGECFRNTTVLPFRFGTVFETDDALRRAVRGNRRVFQNCVAHLRGKSEMHLKLTLRDCAWPQASSEPLPAVAGREYLTSLRQKAVREREAQTKGRALSVAVHKLFNPLQEEVSCKKADSGRLLIDIAHLIDSSSVPKYQYRLQLAVRQLKDCDLVATGPWPPYHFMPDHLRTVAS